MCIATFPLSFIAFVLGLYANKMSKTWKCSLKMLIMKYLYDIRLLKKLCFDPKFSYLFWYSSIFIPRSYHASK